jgi:APA family basic amino acid/polyamine antiporter
MTSVLAWVSARYTLVLFGYTEAPLFFTDAEGVFHYTEQSSLNSPECITIALFYLVLIYFLNTIAPKIAGKFQVSSTAVKLTPIVFIALVGFVVGLFSGNLASNFDFASINVSAIEKPAPSTGLFPAICGTIFAYEGWIVATAINAEIKDSKKNLPIALCIGTLIIVAAYTLYNVGILGLAGIVDVSNGGTLVAFNYFGAVISKIISAFIVVSCLGTLNGLMLGCTRGMYSLAARGEGISPDTLVQIDKKTNMPHNSAAFALLACAVWFVYFIFMGLGVFDFGVISKYGFDSSELPIITIYPLYVPILVIVMIKEKDLHWFKRFVLPITSIIGVGVIVAASIIKHKMANVWYLIVFAIIMLAGYLVLLLNKKRKAANSAEKQ